MIGDQAWPGAWMFFDAKGEREPERKKDTELVEKRQKVLVCAACSATVTHENARIAHNGCHEHTFFNPHGIVYEIGCFEPAPGCRDISPPSAEFTWFPGYRWCVSHCSRCQAHLGWHFVANEHGFYGLILNRLAVGDNSE